MVVEAPLGLAAPPSTDAPLVDVIVTVADPAPVATRGAAGADRVLIEVDDAARGQRYQLRSDTRGYVFDFAGAATVTIDQQGAGVLLTPESTTPTELLEVLLNGPVLTAVAMLRGCAVLHASAVVHEGVVMGLVGPSGAGKSTIAAALHSTGLSLFSDDALVVDRDDEVLCANRGTMMSRLRRPVRLSGATLGEHGRSADGRYLDDVRDGAVTERARLRAVMIPMLSPAFSSVRAVALRGSAAAAALMGHTPVGGIRDPGLLRAQFAAVADVAAEAPVYQLEVPWSRPELEAELLVELRDVVTDALR